jgi:predicted nucleotidyltransferase
MAESVLTAAERKLLSELEQRGVRYLVIGMSAALLQGARGATEDIDLWFEDVTDPRLAGAVRTAGGIWISGALGLGPPRIGGDALGERLDVVARVDGLDAFDVEYQSAHREDVDGIMLPLLPLERILASKRASGRPKDLLAAHLIEDAIIAKRHGGPDADGGG